MKHQTKADNNVSANDTGMDVFHLLPSDDDSHPAYAIAEARGRAEVIRRIKRKARMARALGLHHVG